MKRFIVPLLVFVALLAVTDTTRRWHIEYK